MARPTEYNESFITEARNYIKSCKDNVKKKKVNIPTKGGLAVYLEVARDTLYDWSSKYPEFSDVMEELGSEQENRLINNGLSGTYNPTIAKVLLTKHGYKEGAEIDHTSKGDKINNIPNENISQIAIGVAEKLKEQKTQ